MFLKSGYDISKDFTGYIEVRLYHLIPYYTFSVFKTYCNKTSWIDVKYDIFHAVPRKTWNCKERSAPWLSIREGLETSGHSASFLVFCSTSLGEFDSIKAGPRSQEVSQLCPWGECGVFCVTRFVWSVRGLWSFDKHRTTWVGMP